MGGSSGYPAAFDAWPTNHLDSNGEVIHAADVNNIADAINKIEIELGLLPKGGFANVAARLNAIVGGGGGHRVGIIVAASNATAAVKAVADYVCDGVNDHVEIQAAIDISNRGGVLGAVDNGVAAVGGVVWLIGKFLDVDQIVMKSRVHLRGVGVAATEIRQKTGANKHLLTNYVSSNGTTDPNAQFFEVSDLTLNGNRAAIFGSPGGNVAGNCVYFEQNPQWSAAATDIDYDPCYRISNLFLLNGAARGYQGVGRQHLLADRIDVLYCGTIGITAGADTLWTGCSSGHSQQQGYLIDSNAVLVNCVAWYAGNGNGAAYAGFEITATQGAYLSGCRAQDCGSQGFYLNGCTGTQIVGGQSDSNSAAGTAGQYANIGFNGATNCSVIGMSSTERGAGNGSFNKAPCGLSFAGTNVGSRIDIQHVTIGGTLGTPIKAGSAPGVKNKISMNSTETINALGGPTSPFTPLPLLGTTIEWTAVNIALLVNLPAATDCWPGMRLRFIWVQDATGGRAITWDAGYKTNWSNTGNTASKRQSVEFEYDGTNWNQIGAASGWI